MNKHTKKHSTHQVRIDVGYVQWIFHLVLNATQHFRPFLEQFEWLVKMKVCDEQWNKNGCNLKWNIRTIQTLQL